MPLNPLVITWLVLLIGISFNMSAIYLLQKYSCAQCDRATLVDDSHFSKFYLPEREAFLILGARRLYRR